MAAAGTAAAAAAAAAGASRRGRACGSAAARRRPSSASRSATRSWVAARSRRCASPGTRPRPLVNVKGVLVTEDHAVQVDGGRFVRERDAPGASRAGGATGVVYDLITTDNRIGVVADDGSVLVCADYLEVPETACDREEEETGVLLVNSL